MTRRDDRASDPLTQVRRAEDHRRSRRNRHRRRPCGGNTPSTATGLSFTWSRAEKRRHDRIALTISWNEVTTNTAGASSTMDRYIVQLEHSADGVTSVGETRRFVIAAKDDDSNTTVSHYIRGVRKHLWYRFRVIAVNRDGCRGAWTSWTSWTFAVDRDPPPPPKNVKVFSNATNRIVVDWDPAVAFLPRTGTVDVAAASATVTGTGTWFNAEVGAASRIVVPGPMDPRSISGLLVLLDGDEIGGLADGGAVSTWLDRSGNGYDVTQSGALRPAWKKNVVNGRAGVLFNGSTQYLQNQATGLGLGGSDVPWSLLVVALPLVTNAHQVPFSIGRQAGTGYHMVQFRDDVIFGTIREDDAGASANLYGGSYSQNTPYVISMVFPGTTTEVWRNGSSVITGAMDVGTFSAGLFSIGAARRSAPFYYMNGYVCLVAAWNKALSATERRQMEAYAASRYGTSIPHVRTVSSITSDTSLTADSNWDQAENDVLLAVEEPDPDIAYYQIHVSTSATFASTYKRDDYHHGTKKGIKVADADEASTFYARVRAVDASGNRSSWIPATIAGNNDPGATPDGIFIGKGGAAFLVATFTKPGRLRVKHYPYRFTNVTGQTLTFKRARAVVAIHDSGTHPNDGCPQGSAVKIAIHRWLADESSHATIFADDDKLIIGGGTHKDTLPQTSFAITTLAADEQLSINIKNIGASFPGEDLVVQVLMEP